MGPTRTQHRPRARGLRSLGSWASLCTAILAAGTAVATLATGCIDPDGKYQDFVDRTYTPKDEPTGDAGNDCPSIGDMPLPEPEQLEGTYYYAVYLPPFDPTLYLLEVQASRSGDQYTLMQRNRPLKFADKKTQTGDWSEWETTTVEAAGCYQLTDIMTTTPMDASPIGAETITKLTFKGNVGGAQYESGPTSPVKFWCGTVAGEAISPLPQEVSGVFTATRITDVNNPDSYPDIVTECAANPS
jgi:hypothetical protein